MIRAMHFTEALIAPIKSSPFLPELVDELSAILTAERQRRQKFYEEITPEMKAEFVDGEVVLHSSARNVHLDVTYNVATLLGSYVRAKQLGEANAPGLEAQSVPPAKAGAGRL